MQFREYPATQSHLLILKLSLVCNTLPRSLEMGHGSDQVTQITHQIEYMSDTTETGPTEELPPASLPPNLQLSLMGFDTAENANALGNEFSATLIEISRYMDLERLAGATVTWNFEEAFAAIDRGFEGAKPITYTQTNELVCVAKCIPVLRDGLPHHHVVWHAGYVTALLDPDHEHYLYALHVIAHECGHVVDLKWRDQAFPGVILKEGYDSHVAALLDGTALVVWEEYAACRLSALFSDTKDLRATYITAFTNIIGVAQPNANKAILAYRRHGQIDRVLSEAGEPLCEPLRTAGYLLGHLDGMGDTTPLEELCPAIVGTHYAEMLERLREALRTIWSTRESWSTMARVFADLRRIAEDTVAAGGIHFQDTHEGLMVNIPFTPETVEGGALGMILAKLQQR